MRETEALGRSESRIKETTLARLDTLSETLTNHFRNADATHRQMLACEALRIALESTGIQLLVVLEQVLAGSFEPERLAELCDFCKVKSAQSDELYFEQEEAGEPEAVWGLHFHRARAYAAMAEFCESNDPQLEEVLYEALQSQADPDRLIPRLIELLMS